MKNPNDAWRVSENSFPSGQPSADVLQFLLHYAILAPSSHNTQPWLFRLTANEVEVFSDHRRALPVVDPDDRELIISCGAAIGHLRIAMEHFGFTPEVTMLPNPDSPELLARVGLGERTEPAPENARLFQAITRRRTNRLAFRNEPLPDELLSTLESLAIAEGAWLRLADTDESRAMLADLVSQGDRIQWANKHFRRELAQWIHPNREYSRDGIPGYALGFGDLVSRMEPAIIRTFDLGRGQAAKDRDIALHSPVLAVLGTDDDSPAAWLMAGQALASVLLRARADEVWASFMNQPIEVTDLRPQVAECVGESGFPQLLLRFGYSENVKPTPRRSLLDVMLPSRHSYKMSHGRPTDVGTDFQIDPNKAGPAI